MIYLLNRYVLLFTLGINPAVYAGSIDSPAVVGEAESTMYTLTDIYNRLDSGEAGTLATGTFTEPTSAPGSTGYSLNDIMAISPRLDDTSGTTMEKVLTGTTYWGLSSKEWGLQTGTMPNIGQENFTPTTTDQKISLGYHDGTGVVAGDADLISDNIKAGKEIFGISGKTSVVDTVTGNATAEDMLKNTKAWVNGVEITGTLDTQELDPTSNNLEAGNYKATTLSTIDKDLTLDNIRAGKTIFGITGTYTDDATAVDGDIAEGKTAYVKGKLVTGSVTTQTLSDANDTVTAGLYSGTTLSAVDTDLSEENIKTGITIFGIAGTYTADATADDGDIASRKTAYVDGKKILRNVAAGENITGVDGSITITIPAGIYDGKQTATAVDGNLVAENICNDRVIFGVKGNKTCS